MKVKIENAYEDGHESSAEEEVSEPEVLNEDFWDEMFDRTGDGHGIGTKLGSCYTVTIIEATNPTFVGQSREWID